MNVVTSFHIVGRHTHTSFVAYHRFGCPRLGDKDFSHAFGPRLACKMFHHVHNNDIFARVPFWGTYETPPGTLVFIDSSRSEERRVGKECRSRWSPERQKRKCSD